MRYVCAVVGFAVALLWSGAGAIGAAQQQKTPSEQRALLDQYCVTCHNQRAKTANVMFDAMDLADVSKNAEIWEKAARKLRGGMMPPPGARQPERTAVDSFVTWLENSLDEAAAAVRFDL